MHVPYADAAKVTVHSRWPPMKRTAAVFAYRIRLSPTPALAPAPRSAPGRRRRRHRAGVVSPHAVSVAPHHCAPPPGSQPLSSRRRSHRRGDFGLPNRKAASGTPRRRGRKMNSIEQPPERLRLRSQERARKRKRELVFEGKRTSEYTRGWRVFARQRKFTAERALAALPAGEARNRRRDGLPPPEVGRAVTSLVCVDQMSRVERVAVLPGGEKIATTDADGNLRVSAVEDGALLWEVAAHIDGVYGSIPTELTVLGDKVIASGTRADGYVRTWNADTGEQLCQIKMIGDEISALAALNDHQFVVGCRDGDIVLCEHEQGLRLAQAFCFVNENLRAKFRGVVHFAVCGERLASTLPCVVSAWHHCCKTER